MTPGKDFINKSISKSKLAIWSSFLPYVQRYKRLFFHILIFLLITSVLGFIFPVLTQKIIDDGVQLRDEHLIWIVVVAQLGILISRFFVDFLRSWALLQINYKVDILFLSDFLRKSHSSLYFPLLTLLFFRRCWAIINYSFYLFSLWGIRSMLSGCFFF